MNPLSATMTASDIQTDYMRLLIAQLQNQNPLEPLDNNEMASQLAQFSQLQQLETMNHSFAKVLTSAERTYAASLLGKQVSFLAETETGALDTQNGTVEQVYNNVDEEISLVVGNHIIRLEDVLSVKK
ncbi:MAG: flagellar hook assembly protein FlgD [Sedimentisphaerales bacterium]